MAVPDIEFENIMNIYNQGLETTQIESVMFGHIGDNHIHVNLLPKTMEEYIAGKKLYVEWSRKVVKVGGTVSAEHGIGKIKVDFLKEMYGEEVVGMMHAVKTLFDPLGILNKGNLFG
jgi:D-lactate dehydrogenase (cytochrome)